MSIADRALPITVKCTKYHIKRGPIYLVTQCYASLSTTAPTARLAEREQQLRRQQNDTISRALAPWSDEMSATASGRPGLMPRRI